MIKETARQTDRKPELTEEEKQELDYKLQMAFLFREKSRRLRLLTLYLTRRKQADTDRGILVMERGEQINLDMVVDITVSADWI